jgi:hypothetical protein
MIYEKLKSLKPYSIALKCRTEGSFLITMSEDLEVYYLNEVASDYFQRCNGILTISDIIEHLKSEYDVHQDILKHDIVILTRDLQWKKLIRLKT